MRCAAPPEARKKPCLTPAEIKKSYDRHRRQAIIDAATGKIEAIPAAVPPMKIAM
jgi:hypothetical protein